jgi:hypothetical protein
MPTFGNAYVKVVGVAVLAGANCPKDLDGSWLKGWGGRRESNPQRPEPQSGALPVELLPPSFVIIAIETGERADADARRSYSLR